MKNGNVDDFIYSLYDDSACVRYKGYVYRFSRLRHNPMRGTYTVSVENYHYTKEPFADFLGMVYSYESDDPEDCLNHLTEDILWDGKSFFDLEKALTWFDWEEA